MSAGAVPSYGIAIRRSLESSMWDIFCLLLKFPSIAFVFFEQGRRHHPPCRGVAAARPLRGLGPDLHLLSFDVWEDCGK